MSTAARCWWGSWALVWVTWPGLLWGQPASQEKARATVAAAIQALGGNAWLSLRTVRVEGRRAAFYQGTPTGAGAEVTITTELPNAQRVDLSEGRVVQIYDGRQAWEITYKGKKNLSASKAEDFLRWRNHSLGVVLRQWYSNPATMLIDDGLSIVERRPAAKITLIDSADDAVALEIDAESHLPLRLSFEWRDPRFHDKNLDAVEYDNYQQIDGIATPFTVTRTRNGETVREMFVRRVACNVALPKDFFDADIAARHLK